MFCSEVNTRKAENIMKILPITPYNNNTAVNSGKHNQFRAFEFKNSNLAPLTKDCVTFCGKRKKPEAEEAVEDYSKAKDLDSADMSGKIPYRMGMDINKDCQDDLVKLMADLKKGLKNITESDTNPDLPVLRGQFGIHGRVKKPESILQKVPPRKLRQKKEVLKMGDVIGVRIVLKSSSQKDFALVFRELGKMVSSGKLRVLEVENYRMSPKESYVSKRTLDAFELVCHKANQYPEISSKTRESGYTAIHMTVDLGNGKLGEIQLMGRDMERVKDIEDFFYKKRSSKDFDAKYKPIEDMMNRVMGKTKKDKETGKISYEKLDDFQVATLDRYIRDSYAHAREIPPRHPKRVDAGKGYFLPIPYSLPQELDFDNLQKMKDICDYRSNKQFVI